MNTEITNASPSALHAPGVVQPDEVDAALAHVRAGGLLVVPSNERWIMIDAKCLAKFEKAEITLLRREGNGFRLRRGKGSVFLFAGQLFFAIRKAV